MRSDSKLVKYMMKTMIIYWLTTPFTVNEAEGVDFGRRNEN
jgi:hypothetical protein